MKLFTLGYLQKDDKTLMIHRVKKENDPHEGKYNGLGGKFELGESPEDCFIREIKEESGYDVINPKFAGVLTFPGFWKSEDAIVFVYTVKEFTGDEIESIEGNLEWIETNKLLELNLHEGDYIFLKWILENKFFSAKFNYKDKKLIGYKVNFYNC